MPDIRTDDGPRKLRAVWLGPKGATLPFEWTYVQWAVTILVFVPVLCGAAALICVTLDAIFTPAPINWFFCLIFGAMYGTPAGAYLGIKVMRNVTFDEPVRLKIAVLRSELGRSTRRRRATTTEWVMPWPKITDAPDPHTK